MSIGKKKHILGVNWIICVVVILFVFSSISLAHSGGTDSSGGHTDHSTGEYHYHHGYSAHQHPNGKCPYEFKNNTGSSSGSNGSSSGYVTIVDIQNKKEPENNSAGLLLEVGFIGACIAGGVSLFKKRKN